MSASTLTGDKVVNAAGEDLGKMDEIMLDTPTGRVAYAVLSFGGFLGMVDKLFAIRRDQLSLDEDDERFILNIDRAKLEQPPWSRRIIPLSAVPRQRRSTCGKPEI